MFHPWLGRVLLFFVLSPGWAAVQGEDDCLPMRCGNLTISLPFEVVLDQAVESRCGSIGFQVQCNNNIPYLGYYQDTHRFRILNVFYDNYSLLVSDIHKVEGFTSSEEGCHTPNTNTSSKVGFPFSISTSNQNLIFYNCTKPLAPPGGGLVETICHNNTFARAGGPYSLMGDYGAYSLEGCKATVVPVRGAPGKVNARNYQELISDGFLLTWPHGSDHARHRIKLVLIAALSATIGLVFTCLVWIMHRRRQNLSLFMHQKCKGSELKTEEMLERYQSLTPKRYKYSELKKITGCFKQKIGEGGYGAVFKGSLQDGRMVAVKLLKVSKSNGEDFLNEVTGIGGTSHVNIVNLLGFCLQGSRRALVYQYMVNGSLEKYIYSENSTSAIGWESLQQIAVGIARGLEYLHRGCRSRIIHFDIKPQNVLLDEDFCPKIADFGLAKLCNLKDSALSMAEARGTIGFIAPEVFSRGFGTVSTKSDVYSYGMLLLEMVGGRKNVEENIANSSEAYFPNWIYDRLVQDLQCHEVTSEMEEIAKRMTLVGLWCIQTSPGNRPSISRAIEMLEKNIRELEIPPKPFLSCPSIPSYSTSSQGLSTRNDLGEKIVTEMVQLSSVPKFSTKENEGQT